MSRNVVDLDIAGPEVATGGYACRLRPVFASFDFQAAFPSLDHGFAWASLSAQGSPNGVVNVCKECSDTVVRSEFDGSLRELPPISSSIVQACPMSVWLYTVATDPVVRSLADAVEPAAAGAVRAADDDVGAALDTLAALVPPRGRFQLGER